MPTTKTDTQILEPLVLPPIAPPIKVGWKTSEGKLAIIAMIAAIAGQISGALPEPWPAIIVAVVSCVWTVARTLLKIKALPSVPPA